jgi:hypothetical protein
VTTWRIAHATRRLTDPEDHDRKVTRELVP